MGAISTWLILGMDSIGIALLQQSVTIGAGAETHGAGIAAGAGQQGSGAGASQTGAQETGGQHSAACRLHLILCSSQPAETGLAVIRVVNETTSVH